MKLGIRFASSGSPVALILLVVLPECKWSIHFSQQDNWFSFPQFSRIHKVCEDYTSFWIINLLVIVLHRSVSCRYVITNKCLSHTRCILPTTRRVGNRARLSSEHSQSTLRSSLSEYGLYLIRLFILNVLALTVRINAGIPLIQWDWYLVGCHSLKWIIISGTSVTLCPLMNIGCG